MGLWFENVYSETVFVALLWYDAGCQPDPWRKVGWYRVEPDTGVQVVTGNLQNAQDPYYAWFAQAEFADGPCWSGDPAHAWYAIPHNAGFNQCYDDDTGCNAAYPFIVSKLNPAWPDATIILDAPGTAGRGFQGIYWAIQGRPANQSVNFTVPSQQQTNWCWAAVSTGIAHYYDSASTVTQCDVVNQQLVRRDCCRNGGSKACNVYGYLGQALTFVGHLASEEAQAATFDQVVAAIDVGTPPCIRIAWSGGGAHFIVISGCQDSVLFITAQMLWVTDPIYGRSLVFYDTLTGGSYQGSGTWTHTFFTT